MGDPSAIGRQPFAMRVELSLYGELDASSAAELEAQLFRWFESEAARETVIALRVLARIDSTGLARLQRAGQYARQLGHNSGLRRATGEVERLIALVGLDETLPFID